MELKKKRRRLESNQHIFSPIVAQMRPDDSKFFLFLQIIGAGSQCGAVVLIEVQGKTGGRLIGLKPIKFKDFLILVNHSSGGINVFIHHKLGGGI